MLLGELGPRNSLVGAAFARCCCLQRPVGRCFVAAIATGLVSWLRCSCTSTGTKHLASHRNSFYRRPEIALGTSELALLRHSTASFIDNSDFGNLHPLQDGTGGSLRLGAWRGPVCSEISKGRRGYLGSGMVSAPSCSDSAPLGHSLARVSVCWHFKGSQLSMGQLAALADPGDRQPCPSATGWFVP